MDACCQFAREQRVNEAVPLKPALARKRLRYDIDTEMRFAVRTVARMTCMKM